MAKSGFHEGRLGIGLTPLMGMGDGNPRYPLDINGDIRLTGAIVNAAGEALNMAGADSTWQVDANNITYNGAGNVGIGTPMPGAKLHIVDTGIEGKIIIENETLALLQLKQPTSNKTYNIELGRTDGELTFRSTAGEKMRIKENGNVGIGTPTPNYKLDIVGDINFTGNLYKNGGSISSDWECQVEWNTGNAGGTGQIIVNGIQIASGGGGNGSGIGAKYLNKDGSLKGSSTSYYLWPNISYHWNTLADEINNQDNGTIIIIYTTDWIMAPSTSGSAQTLFESIGSSEVFKIPAGRYGYICAFIKGCYGCIEKLGNDSSYHNGYVKFSYFNLINITSGQYNYSSTESPDYQLTNMHVGNLSSSGNVGIGTTSPVTDLQVGNTTTKLSDTILTLASDGGNNYKQGIRMIHHGGAPSGGTDGTQYGWYMFGSDVTDKLHIGKYEGSSAENDAIVIDRATGNVGIGTTSPTAPLHVENNGVANGNSEIIAKFTRGTSAGNGDGFVLIEGGNVGGGADNDEVGLLIRGSRTGDYWGIICDDDGTTGNLYIQKDSDFQFDQNYAFMTIGANGNVGIGTTSPGTFLEVHTDDSNHGIQVTQANSDTFTFLGYDSLECFSSSTQQGVIVNGAAPNKLYLQWHSRGDLILNGNGGNVGIGTQSPKQRLDVGNGKICFKGSQFAGDCGISYYYRTQATERKILFFDTGGSTIIRSTDNNSTDGIKFQNYAGTERMFIQDNGFVTIGTATPYCPLYVYGNYYTPSGQPGAAGYLRYSSTIGTSSNSYNDYITIRASNSIWAGQYVFANSDRRIKKNIVDVPDNLALQMVRDIPCRYYEYTDKVTRGIQKTIGFIAQEVKEIMPMAVSIQKDIIPNEMRQLEDINWEEITDGSNNIYKLTTDLQDISGIKYRFYVSNDINGNDEIEKEITGNTDNTFTFDNSYNTVFCYGKEVDDFHTLAKEKIFTLHHSAIQEIDRKQLADKEEITQLKEKNTTLENKVVSLESELAVIKAHLGI